MNTNPEVLTRATDSLRQRGYIKWVSSMALFGADLALFVSIPCRLALYSLAEFTPELKAIAILTTCASVAALPSVLILANWLFQSAVKDFIAADKLEARD